MQPAIFYNKENTTKDQQYKNYLVIKKLKSFSNKEYNFEEFMKEHGKDKKILMVIEPKTEKEYKELLQLMPNGIMACPK